MDSLNNLEYDEAYNPSHKTSSITSIDSADHPPSLYTGRADSCSSLCDPDELREPLFFDDPNPYEILKMKQRSSISIPFEELETYSCQSFIIPANDKQIQEPITFESPSFELNNHPPPHEEEEEQKEKKITSKEINSYSDELNYSTSCENNDHQHQQQQHTNHHQPSSSSSSSSSSSNTLKVLSQDEKRANHIASEQKRRQNIRHGFKQLSDIIPTLKNMPHSKSTILFKAADYIKHTEKRNKILQERLKHLQRKLALSTTISHQYPSASISSSSTIPTSSSSSLLSSSSPSSIINHHPASLYHSTQEKIRLLQQQLLHQQQLLLKHNIIPHHPYYHRPSTSSAIVMPAQQDDHHHQLPSSSSSSSSQFNSTPCLHIPADEDYYQEPMHRERLLSCGKLNFN